MASISVTVPDPDVPDVLAGLETRWATAAKVFTSGYDGLSNANKAKACIAASLRAYALNYRRAQAEAAISVVEPNIT